MEKKQYKDGDIIIRQGEAGDFVYQIESGEAEVYLRHGDREIVVGSVNAGELLGEMGVMGDRGSRSASARAKGEVLATRLDRDEFLHRVSRDVDMAYRVIGRLSERLRSVNSRLAESVATAEPGGDQTTLTLYPGDPAVRLCVPESGLAVSRLPFVVGRLIDTQDPAANLPDLAIPDAKPYRLSRRHFALLKTGDGYVVHDLESTLGTEVNGESLGKHFGRDFKPLEPGDNVIVAGGRGSQFVFKAAVRR